MILSNNIFTFINEDYFTGLPSLVHLDIGENTKLNYLWLLFQLDSCLKMACIMSSII